MTLHQVNADGAGPYECMIDQTGTGASFTPVVVTQNVLGQNGRERDRSEIDFPVVAQMPANMACTGTARAVTGICMVRCQNPANAGPFGGCVPVQQAGAGAAAGAGAGAGAAASNTLANVGVANTLSAGNAAATNNAANGNTNANGNNTGANNNGAGPGGNTPKGNTAGAGAGGNNTPGGLRGLGRFIPKRFRA
ncbi:hypothetical protein L873DRAFT_1788289 [Choiromyces venosus 120613-1]|uniref:Uncharacterized protein n=1 Tax=Choiromyces venosus 120613-1 TaxID=1336337 RepID=A0A3N4JXD2_9PEZI|nr:hypothetical protein L873DRAFT_1788289 [Choiromyces venosus 120613-1]